MRHGAGVGGHLRRIAEAEGVAGHRRLRRRQAGEIPGAFARGLGLEVPQRAVERVARRAGRQQIGQAFAAQRTAQSAQRMQRVLDGLAVARIGNGLAAARVAAGADVRHDDMRLGLGAARDNERLGKRPCLGLGFDELGFAVQRHGAQPRRPEAWARNR